MENILLMFLITLYVLCIFGCCEDLKDLNPLELIKLGEDVSEIHPYKFEPNDVTFYLLTQNNKEPLLVTNETVNLVDNKKPTKIIIHGWLENRKRSWYANISEEYLNNFDLNFIEVDWEKPARTPYVTSARITKYVGREIANFIQAGNLTPSDVHLIGHSLGSHVAGFAGKEITAQTGQKLGRISALDPAGPFFREALITPDDRLDKNDAIVVDVLHTDAGFYGYEDPIGTLDIYVNGGQRIQPGCLDDIYGNSFGTVLEKSFCSHARSTKYFTEWIASGKFHCRICEPVFGYNFVTERCLRHRDVDLGSQDVDSTTTGICFARTNRKEPFLS